MTQLLDDIRLVAPAPEGVRGGAAQVFGSRTGLRHYYYWVIAHYPIGATVSGPFIVRDGPNRLDAINYVLVVWEASIGAENYDVLRTSTGDFPAEPGDYALVLATTEIFFQDTGQPLEFYDPRGLPFGAPVARRITLNNRDYEEPTIEIDTQLSVTQIIFPDESVQITAGVPGPVAPREGLVYGLRPPATWEPVVQLSGDTMTGPLILAGDPIVPLQAATKEYVDSLAFGSDAPSDGFDYGRKDGAWVRCVQLAGDTMSGPLTINADISQSGFSVLGGNAVLATANFRSPVNGGVAIATIGGIVCNGGLSLGAVLDAGPPTDLTNHLRLWQAPTGNSGFGFSVSSGQLNYVVNASTDIHAFVDPTSGTGGTWATIGANGLTLGGSTVSGVFNYFTTATGQGYFLGPTAINGGFYVRGIGTNPVITIRCATGNAQPTIENNSGGGARNIVDTLGATFTGALYAPAFNVTSDIALKQEIEDPSLAELAAAFSGLLPRRFRRRAEPGRWELGFMAQDIAEIAPDVVSGDEGAKSYSLSDVVAIAIGKIRYDEQRIRQLEDARLFARLKRTWRKLRDLCRI